MKLDSVQKNPPAQTGSQISSSTTLIETGPQPPIGDLGTTGSQIGLAPESDNSVEKGRAEEVDHVSLWDQAYDTLKKEQPKLVLQYEKLLSRVLDDSNPSSPSYDDLDNMENLIPQGDRLDRQKKMAEARERGLKHVEDEKASMSILGHKVILQDAMGGIAEGIEAAQTYVKGAIKDVPYAPAVVAGISLVLPLFKNPSAVEAANREGLAYVISQMSYYGAMEPLLLQDQKRTALDEDLFGRVAGFYKMVTEFQIQSILCTIPVKFNHLKNIRKTADESCGKLENIREGVQQLVMYAKDNEKQKFLEALQTSDPSDEKDRIEEEKGFILQGTTDWILGTPEFQ
ncbi:hypothetical protein N7509_006736 [Penicillium cosmopolitanum]|uniref:NWD NACHT-NTPase N-terminal domain-containing protein n=1 Tax=Penicillium cosmopolitanum TaxID=1131564 RepID=A0A9W9VXS3_9EURO|nr:uncharacterized protein N7509_006736 [Penicillium cosmopolitanum]KAJ5391246.1 hypothetical protein N7509_006736 [Penicillium cosmopolitanum]